MGLPKVVQVTVTGELAELLTRAKKEQPDASWSKLVGSAAKKGFKASLADERLEALTPSLTELDQ